MVIDLVIFIGNLVVRNANDYVASRGTGTHSSHNLRYHQLDDAPPISPQNHDGDLTAPQILAIIYLTSLAVAASLMVA
jgi:hypothetical protein